MNNFINDIEQFYQTTLGKAAAWAMNTRLQRTLGETRLDCLVGLGYTAPFIKTEGTQAFRCFTLFPEQLGATHWTCGTHPDGTINSANKSALIDEEYLPIAPNSVSCFVLVHMLEHASFPETLMEELYNALAPEGRLIIIIPNRRGLWSRRDITPFGHGNPYSRSQLIKLMKKSGFKPEIIETILFFPPTRSWVLTRYAEGLEVALKYPLAPWGGVYYVEATKHINALIKTPTRRKRLLLTPNLLMPGAHPATRTPHNVR